MGVGAMRKIWGEAELSIRLLSSEGAVPCRRCGQTVAPATPGAQITPIGFEGQDPLCDGCLLRLEPRLGMLLAVAGVVLSYGGGQPANPGEELALRAELLAFARVYARWACDPARPLPKKP